MFDDQRALFDHGLIDAHAPAYFEVFGADIEVGGGDKFGFAQQLGGIGGGLEVRRFARLHDALRI
ncbi:hypothetical protein SDC9_80413 [bioreactor metagenome]|uniref:Uncharacterized protein n=1 Tax=bioreactor metagenome TaxID=1076179 RepID=A0A644YZC9_9ZZZZ